jgi:hypothetical protein
MSGSSATRTEVEGRGQRGFLLRVVRHPPESAFEEVGDYTKSLGTGRFAAQLTEIANQLSVPIVGIRGTVRPLRDWNQEHGHALCGVGGSDNRRPWQVRAPGLCLS